MSIGWDDLVDVPEEEPERQLAPWEIYMTDPVVRTAVEQLANREEIPLPTAAEIVAKTLAPAPHYVAAQDARYLLAPEAAEQDQAEADFHLGPVTTDLTNLSLDAQAFADVARRHAQMDGPSTEEGLRFATELENAPQRAQSRSYDAPVPPQRDEGNGLVIRRLERVLAMDRSSTVGTQEEQHQLSETIRSVCEELDRRELVPLHPPTVTFWRDSQGGPRTAHVQVDALPDQGRAWEIGVMFGTEEAIETCYRNEAEQMSVECYATDLWQGPGFATMVVWDRHPHEDVAVTIMEIGPLDGDVAEQLRQGGIQLEEVPRGLMALVRALLGEEPEETPS